MAVLTVQNISKNYGSVKALANLSFSVPPGSVYGILGPNGSGKTTTLGIITDILKPTTGDYLLFGEKPQAEHRRSIGTLLETPNFYHYLSGVKNLEIAAEIKGKGREDIHRVLQMVDLTARKNSKFSTYSLGMKQRLAIASALLGDPGVLIFDEPTNGLDPVGIAEIRELIISLRHSGKTIIMASHLLDEVEKVCTHVAILKKGRLIAEGRVDEILSNEDTVEIASTNMALLIEILKTFPGTTGVDVHSRVVKLSFEAGTAQPADINDYCFQKGVIVNHLILKRKSLETRFLELTNTNEHAATAQNRMA